MLGVDTTTAEEAADDGSWAFFAVREGNTKRRGACKRVPIVKFTSILHDLQSMVIGMRK